MIAYQGVISACDMHVTNTKGLLPRTTLGNVLLIENQHLQPIFFVLVEFALGLHMASKAIGRGCESACSSKQVTVAKACATFASQLRLCIDRFSKLVLLYFVSFGFVCFFASYAFECLSGGLQLERAWKT